MLQGIREIKKTSSQGLIDTYTIYYTSGVETTFTVTNGKDATISNVGFWLQFDPQTETFYVDSEIITSVERLNKELAKVESTLITKVDDLSQSTTQKLAKLTTNLNDNVDRLNNALNDQNINLTKKIESEAVDRKTAVDDLSSDITNKLSDVDAKITTLESNITTDLNNKITALTDNLSSLDTKITDNADKETKDIKAVQNSITIEANNRAVEVAYDILATIDETDQNILHISLLNKNAQQIATTTINLPASVQSAQLDTTKKQLIIKLANESEVTCDVSTIIDALTRLSDSIESVNTTVRAIKTSVEQLDYTSSGTASQTITGLTQVDGKISAEYSNIQIEQKQVTALTNALENLQANLDSGDKQTLSKANNYTDEVKNSLDNTIAQVKSVIPSDASASNQLADKDFVDKTISGTIAKLDYVTTDSAVSKTVRSLSQTDGVLEAEFADIQIEQAQVNGLTDALKSLQANISTGDEDIRTYVDTIKTDLNRIETLIPPEATTDNTLADKNFVSSAIQNLDYTNTDGATSKTITSLTQTDGKIEAKYTDISITEAQVQNLGTTLQSLQASIDDTKEALSQSVDGIKAMIPTGVSSTNQLADKEFVNSSISTATATFRGTVSTLSELKKLTGDLNDYAFVKVTDETTGLIKQYDRYKYTDESKDETGSWAFEYTLNSSSFTQDQWKAITSGITSQLTNQISTNTTSISAHNSNTDNPHNVTKAQVGLGDVVNTGDSATPVQNGTTKFTTGGAYTELAKKVDKVDGKALSTNDFTSTLKTKLEGIETGAQKNIVTSVAGQTGAVSLTKSDVGLGNVDNTSDENKPISTATQEALDQKQDKLTTIQQAAVDSGITSETLGSLATKDYVSTAIATAITAALEASY